MTAAPSSSRGRVAGVGMTMTFETPDRGEEMSVAPFSAGFVWPVLEGRLMRLEPLSHRHAADLAVACEEDRDSYRFTRVPSGQDISAYIDAYLGRAASGKVAPYAVMDKLSGCAVGVTAYCDPRPRLDGPGHRGVEIGFSWLAASAQGRGLNADAKLQLFEFAFTTLGVARVDLMTDARNRRSRAAIERVGATFEGVLRNWSRSWKPGEDGLLRDTAVYSVIEEEWARCRATLVERCSMTTNSQ